MEITCIKNETEDITTDSTENMKTSYIKISNNFIR